MLLPYALTGATVEHYLLRVRALGAGPNPFAPSDSVGALSVLMQYVATVERLPAGSVVHRVTLQLRFQLYCGPLCALSFTKTRIVEFDAAGRVTSIQGDGPPSYVVSATTSLASARQAAT